MQIDELEAEIFLRYLKNTDPELYRSTISFIRDRIENNSSGIGALSLAPVATTSTNSTMQNITSGLNTAISALQPLAQSYQNFKTQKATLKSQSAQDLIAVKTAAQQQAALDYQNQQKLAYYDNFKTFGIPALGVIALFIWKMKNDKEKKVRKTVRRQEV